MNANLIASTINLKPIDEVVIVGKDVLELLAGAMYADPLSIFREYVQNAADAIDEARLAGLNSDGVDVSIHFDHSERTVVIRDTGIGVPSKDFVRRLTSVGGSLKRGSPSRGFRGVGRLAGLGYCQELIFRSRAPGQRIIREMRWDCRILRERLRDVSYTGSLPDVVAEIARITEASGDEYPPHFFEVELRKVVRVKNDILMNEVAVRDYLKQVAPVPFDPACQIGQEISRWMSAQELPEPIVIELNDQKGPIFHRVSDRVEFSGTTSDEIVGVDFVEFHNSDGEMLALGWILEHNYMGAIPKRLGVGGLRLRSGNIQVGDDTILSPQFKESRFSSWAIGELHVVHPRIIPNGRRDEYELTPQYVQLTDKLRQFASDITLKIRTRSAQRVKVKKIQGELATAESWLALALNKQLHETIQRVALSRASTFIQSATQGLEKLDEGFSGRELVKEILVRVRDRAAKRQQSYRNKPLPKKNTKAALHIAAVEAVMASSPRPEDVAPLAAQVLSAMGKLPTH